MRLVHRMPPTVKSVRHPATELSILTVWSSGCAADSVLCSQVSGSNSRTNACRCRVVPATDKPCS